MTVSVSIVNESSVLDDTHDVAPAMAAFRKQVQNDWASMWGLPKGMHLYHHTSEGDPPANHWWIAILDDSDQAGALGYHDVTPTGLPLGKVFAKTDIDNNLSWSVTLSHELLEMLADPEINQIAQVNDHTAVAYEVCDAVEDDTLGYQIDGVQVSDFVTPYWFMPSMKNVDGIKFSFRDNVANPLELAVGGYISVLDLTTGQWSSDNAAESEKVTGRTHPRPGSRRERRQRSRNNWRTSSSTAESS